MCHLNNLFFLLLLKKMCTCLQVAPGSEQLESLKLLRSLRTFTFHHLCNLICCSLNSSHVFYCINIWKNLIKKLVSIHQRLLQSNSSNRKCWNKWKWLGIVRVKYDQWYSLCCFHKPSSELCFSSCCYVALSRRFRPGVFPFGDL